MYIDIIARGPVTALGCLVSVASLALGQFFLSLYQTATDCAANSKTGAACGVDIFETALAGVISAGAAAGAVYVGLVSPTPRDTDQAIFTVDGQTVDWYEGMRSHRYGANRTSDNPAVVAWQHNSSAPIQTYYSYMQDDHLVMRHDTGLDIPHPKGKRATCRAFLDMTLYGDELRAGELQRQPTLADLTGLSQAILNKFAYGGYESGCLLLAADEGDYFAQVDFGGSCSEDLPEPKNCNNYSYNDYLYKLTT